MIFDPMLSSTRRRAALNTTEGPTRLRVKEAMKVSGMCTCQRGASLAGKVENCKEILLVHKKREGGKGEMNCLRAVRADRDGNLLELSCARGREGMEVRL